MPIADTPAACTIARACRDAAALADRHSRLVTTPETSMADRHASRAELLIALDYVAALADQYRAAWLDWTKDAQRTAETPEAVTE